MSAHTYYLDGNTAKVQASLYAPYKYSRAWIDDAYSRVDRYRIIRVTEYVLGFLSLLVTYPLKLLGDYLERRAEPISTEIYQTERAKWQERFKAQMNHSVCQDRIIEILIKSRIRPEECRFKSILLTFLDGAISGRFASRSGKECRFVDHINDSPSSCLIIGYTEDVKLHQKCIGDGFMNEQIPSYQKEDFHQKLHEVTWFWLGIDWQNMSSLSVRQQIVSLFQGK